MNNQIRYLSINLLFAPPINLFLFLRNSLISLNYAPNMTNQEVFYHIEKRNHQVVLKFFSSFSESFYFFCKKQDKLKFLNEHQIQAIFDDACVCMYEKIETKQITLHQMSSTIQTMIFGIGKNMAFQEGRNEVKYHSLHVFLEDSLHEISEEEANDNFSQELQMQELDEALLGLSDKHHALIVEGIMEGKSNSEIAKEQGYTSANAVSVEKLRAFKVLKQAIFKIQKRQE